MDSLLAPLLQRGYPILFAAVFLESVGFPVPAALALVVAGAASATGALQPVSTVAVALVAMLTGDVIMFLVGRHTGWWLLGLLCRISLDPESCVLRSADTFYKRGRSLLLFAKFVPGVNTLAPPIAGSMNMKPRQFIALDFVGASLYVGFYSGVGFLFSDALQTVTKGYETLGSIIAWILGAGTVGYLAYQIYARLKSNSFRTVPRVSASAAAEAINSGADAVIYDVRSHGYYERKAMRIRDSQRLDPNSLNHYDTAALAGRQIFFYCTCFREATSIRVAHMLQQKGFNCAVIEGGMRSWKQAGLPLEPVPEHERIELPTFA